MGEEFPVAEGVDVTRGETIYKTGKWWCAVLLTNEFGKERIALYLWLKDPSGKWKRKQKFAIRPDDWLLIKSKIDQLLRKQGH